MIIHKYFVQTITTSLKKSQKNHKHFLTLLSVIFHYFKLIASRSDHQSLSDTIKRKSSQSTKKKDWTSKRSQLWDKSWEPPLKRKRNNFCDNNNHFSVADSPQKEISEKLWISDPRKKLLNKHEKSSRLNFCGNIPYFTDIEPQAETLLETSRRLLQTKDFINFNASKEKLFTQNLPSSLSFQRPPPDYPSNNSIKQSSEGFYDLQEEHLKVTCNKFSNFIEVKKRELKVQSKPLKRRISAEVQSSFNAANFNWKSPRRMFCDSTGVPPAHQPTALDFSFHKRKDHSLRFNSNQKTLIKTNYSNSHWQNCNTNATPSRINCYKDSNKQVVSDQLTLPLIKSKLGLVRSRDTDHLNLSKTSNLPSDCSIYDNKSKHCQLRSIKTLPRFPSVQKVCKKNLYTELTSGINGTFQVENPDYLYSCERSNRFLNPLSLTNSNKKKISQKLSSKSHSSSNNHLSLIGKTSSNLDPRKTVVSTDQELNTSFSNSRATDSRDAFNIIFGGLCSSQRLSVKNSSFFSKFLNKNKAGSIHYSSSIKQNLDSENLLSMGCFHSVSSKAKVGPCQTNIYSNVQASIDKSPTIIEEFSPIVLRYRTPYFRAYAQVIMPPIRRKETWTVGWIQACDHMKFVNQYGMLGSSSWEIPALKTGKIPAVSDSDGVSYPWYGNTTEIATIVGPTDTYKCMHLTMNDNFYPSVTWDIPVSEGTSAHLTRIVRDQSFITWLAAINETTKDIIVLKTVRWNFYLEIDVDPSRELGCRARIVAPRAQKQPFVTSGNGERSRLSSKKRTSFNMSTTATTACDHNRNSNSATNIFSSCQIPFSALVRPSANNAQTLIWRPTGGHPVVVVPAKESHSDVNELVLFNGSSAMKGKECVVKTVSKQQVMSFQAQALSKN